MIGTVQTKITGGMATHTQELVENLKNLNINILFYKINSRKIYNRFFDCLKKIFKRTIGVSLKLLKDSKKVDIVHVQASGPIGGFLPAIISAFWKKILNFKLIITFHYSQTESFLNQYPNISRFVLERIDNFIVVSKRQRKFISSILGDKYYDKISVIPNGYNPNKLKVINKKEARKKLNLKSNSRVLLNIGLLFEKKGQKYLIQAMEKIVDIKEYSDVNCYIIGQGPLLNELQLQIDKYNLKNHINLPGFVSIEELNLYLNSADIFVLPSLNEGNPTVMFEALSVGLPFVGTNVGGIPEIIISDEYGFIVEPSNPKQLIDKIIKALKKSWDNEKIKRYAAQFSWKNIARQTKEIYEKII